MTVKSFTFNPFQTNCYVCHDAGEAVLIDPSSHTESERTAVLDYVDQEELTVKHLLLTHAHIDHILDCAFYADHFGLGWQVHRADLPLLHRAEEQGKLFGIAVPPPPEPGGFLEEGDMVAFGDATWNVLHTPGHSPGSICLYDRSHHLVIAGDVLFQGSIGRTDLWMGSLPQLMQSIFQKLVPLGDDVNVYPGHGSATTIGRERKTNPFLTTGFAALE
ncbi:MAG TPA: MBL fold metallo-hydrolase [Rhodothermales bacterium]|nr:MBL fold metallo-hydrolase [Rhodothermales bacterium]